MAVAVLDANSVVAAVNDAYVEQLMSRKASVGSAFTDIFEEPDRQAISDALARSAGGGMANVDGVRVFSCGPGPNDFPRNALFNWTLLKHNDGFLAAAAPVSGTTGPSSSEAEELKDFFNKAPIALHWLGSNGKVLWCNDRELEVLGYSREEYIGSDIMDFCPDSKDGVLEIFKQLGTGNTIRDVPVRFRTKAGKIQDLLIDSNVNYKSDGSFNHTRCFIRDDTGRILREARAESAATAARKLAEGKERFSAKLLHNIRTPLHIMTMSLSDPNSMDVPVLASQLRSLSGLCVSVAQAMKFDEGYFVTPLPTPTNLSSLIRDYKKVEGVRHEVVVEEIGFDESLVVVADGKMIRTVLDELIAHADGQSPAGASIGLSVERKEGMEEEGQAGHFFEFRVVNSGQKLDERRVEEVFHNYWLGDADALVQREERSNNASSSTEVEESRMARLSSSDEAPGLRLNVAFNYVQCLDSTLEVVSDTSTTTLKFSLPLQTSVLQEARADAEAHHSRKEMPPSTCTPSAWSSSIPPRLESHHSWQEILPPASPARPRSPIPPRLEAHHSWKEISSSVIPPAASSSSIPPRLEPGLFPKDQPGVGIYGASYKHILIVEDNTICQKMCKRIVTRLGHTADTADNGAIAVDMATKKDVNIYDMVLMDIRMPVMDGITAATKIHQVFPELPIVAFSAEEGELTQAEALGVMVAFMRKPANSNEMKRIIQEHARPPLVDGQKKRTCGG